MQITIADKPIEIAPLKVRQLGPVLAAIGPLFRDGIWQSSADVADLLVFIGGHTDRIVDAVAAATDTPRDWLADLEPLELATLAFAVLEVNRDFFSRQVTPALARLNETLTRIGLPPIAVSAQDGRQPS